MRKKTLIKALKNAEEMAFKDAANCRYNGADICYLMFNYLRKALADESI